MAAVRREPGVREYEGDPLHRVFRSRTIDIATAFVDL
jgi:hypothetical protein